MLQILQHLSCMEQIIVDWNLFGERSKEQIKPSFCFDHRNCWNVLCIGYWCPLFANKPCFLRNGFVSFLDRLRSFIRCQNARVLLVGRIPPQLNGKRQRLDFQPNSGLIPRWFISPEITLRHYLINLPLNWD